EAGIILGLPKRHPGMKKAVRDQESACGQTRPEEASTSPNRDQEWKPADKSVDAVDRQRRHDESASGADFADQVLDEGDKEIAASEEIDAVLLELMRKVDDEQEPVEARQAVALLLRPAREQEQREEGRSADPDNHPCRHEIVAHRHELDHCR